MTAAEEYRLRVLGVRLASGDHGWADEAVNLAVALVAAGDDSSATLELACMSPGALERDVEPVLRLMFEEQGVAAPPWQMSEEQHFDYVLDAFTQGAASIEQLASCFYGLVTAWDDQTELQRVIVVGLDRWETQSSSDRRYGVAEDLRRAVAALVEPKTDGHQLALPDHADTRQVIGITRPDTSGLP